MFPDHRSSWRVLQAILVSAGTILAACGGTDTSPTTDASVPVLSVPVVDLTLLYDFKPFGLSEGSGHINPTYVFYTTGVTTSVRAAGPGTVINTLANPAREDFGFYDSTCFSEHFCLTLSLGVLSKLTPEDRFKSIFQRKGRFGLRSE